MSISRDPRIEAYWAPRGPEVFSGIVHGSQIWTPDPFDVELIHSDARDAFAKLLYRASTPHGGGGKILLLLGEGGSGKTHLMRAFWAATHDAGAGYCGYFQLATQTDHYGRYVLSKLINSLEQPYKAGHTETGLKRLARAVLDAIDVISAEERRMLCDDLLEPAEVEELVHRLAYLAVQMPPFQGVDINVIRALLFTLANDARIHSAVIQWLRCEDLSRRDRELLGDLIPRPQPEMPVQTIITLGRLMDAIGGAALVLLVDEMEATYDRNAGKSESATTLLSAVNTLVEIADAVPNSIIAIGCLHTIFKDLKERIPHTKRDRLERDPEPIYLGEFPAPNEIESMLALRLEAIFRAAGIGSDANDPIAPFTKADVEGLAGFRARDILDNLRKHREACILAGDWVKPIWRTAESVSDSGPIRGWPDYWNDHLADFNSPAWDDEPQLAELITFGVRTLAQEYASGLSVSATRDDRFIAVQVPGPGGAADHLLMAVCNKSTRGGGLGNQIKQVAAKAGAIPAILIRSTEFPRDAKQVVAKEIAKLVAPVGKGKRVVVADADWRALAAFRDFHARHSAAAGFAEWQRADRPLSGLTAMRAILGLDARKFESPPAITAVPKPAPVPDAAPTPAIPAPAKPTPMAVPAGAIHLGQTRANSPVTVDLAASEFCRHAAFLGGSGSGKTTAALTIIEQLLMQGVPVVLLDRKGDLGRYADPEAWAESEPDPERGARRARFREAVEPVIYTPGSEKGRPLRIPVVPDLAGLTTAEIEQMAQSAAAGLTQMMGYNQKSPDPKSVILQKAIEVLGRSGTVTVRALQQLVSDMDESLTNETEGYEERHFKKLGQDLLTLAHMHRRLLEGGEPLDIDALLGRGASARTGRTRLTVVNTQFLGDEATVEFWVAQFLLCIDRWRAKSPSAALQAVFFFDEAEKYLPAVGKPASKAPMESLLRRGRSAGVGIFLATQSPGDLDYKCRDQVATWLLGLLKESVAIAKLKPMLDRKPDAADKLAGQSAGEFYLVREAGVSPIRVARNLVQTAQLPEGRILELARNR